MTNNPATNRLKDNVVLIAGAASGIGAAIAQRCVAEGPEGPRQAREDDRDLGPVDLRAPRG